MKNSTYGYLKNNRQKIEYSGMYAIDRKRDVSPSISACTSRAEELFNEMEINLKGENKNLKQHNSYLNTQIRQMFEREKRYKKSINKYRQKVIKLEQINQHLNQQMTNLKQIVFEEIDRLQTLIEMERKSTQGSLLLHSNYQNMQKNKDIFWETESTLNNNLEELKNKIQIILSSDQTKNSKESNDTETNSHFVQYKIIKYEKTQEKMKQNKINKNKQKLDIKELDKYVQQNQKFQNSEAQKFETYLTKVTKEEEMKKRLKGRKNI